MSDKRLLGGKTSPVWCLYARSIKPTMQTCIACRLWSGVTLTDTVTFFPTLSDSCIMKPNEKLTREILFGIIDSWLMIIFDQTKLCFGALQCNRLISDRNPKALHHKKEDIHNQSHELFSYEQTDINFLQGTQSCRCIHVIRNLEWNSQDEGSMTARISSISSKFSLDCTHMEYVHWVV